MNLSKRLSAIFDQMATTMASNLISNKGLKDLMLYKRWPWHLLFWIGYILFRAGVYYITLEYYARVYLEYMLLSEILFVAMVYFTVWLYKKLFATEKFRIYFLVGALSWIAYLYARTSFQFYYLEGAPGFKNNSFSDFFLNSITVVIVYFLFITSCKNFKDGYIRQQFEAEIKEQQLQAEVNNLKSQIAPHFLFNTLNNLYGLAVEKSEKLPDLMLRLSDLLRHSLYETQKSSVPLQEEISVLKSYTDLETIRLESDLKLEFHSAVPEDSKFQIAPLVLIVFVENAFKHSKLVHGEPIYISINLALEGNFLILQVKNNYNKDQVASNPGIGLVNVKRRLEVLYPTHLLTIKKDEHFFSIELRLPLLKDV